MLDDTYTNPLHSQFVLGLDANIGHAFLLAIPPRLVCMFLYTTVWFFGFTKFRYLETKATELMISALKLNL